MLAARVLCLLLAAGVVSADSFNQTLVQSPCSAVEGNPPSPDWVNYGGFIILIVAVIAMFWGLALVCEDFFVPALNVFCEEWKVPKDVAGATVMAAGASSPELFTALIGLLIYQSNIGLGTVVGSEIFNHMIISAGSVLYAQGGELVLDVRIIMRDLVAYMVSMLFFVYTLMPDDQFGPSIASMFNRDSWSQCLSLTTLKSGELLLLYVLYAVVCGNFQKLIAWFCPRVSEDDSESPTAAAATSSSSSAGGQVKRQVNQALLYSELQCLRSKPNMFKLAFSAALQEMRERSMAEALFATQPIYDAIQDTEEQSSSREDRAVEDDSVGCSACDSPLGTMIELTALIHRPNADEEVLQSRTLFSDRDTPTDTDRESDASGAAAVVAASVSAATIAGTTTAATTGTASVYSPLHEPLTPVKKPSDSVSRDSFNHDVTTDTALRTSVGTTTAAVKPSAGHQTKPRVSLCSGAANESVVEALRLHEQKLQQMLEKQRIEEEQYKASGVDSLTPNSKWKVILQKHKEGQLLQLAAARRVKKRYIPQDDESWQHVDNEAFQSWQDVDLEAFPSTKPSSPQKNTSRTTGSLVGAQPSGGKVINNMCSKKQLLKYIKHAYLWITDSFPPADSTTVVASEESLSCYLYVYCDVIGLDALPKFHQWVLRYYTIDSAGFHSVSAGEASSAHHEQCEIFDLVFVSGVAVTDLNKFRFALSFEDDSVPPVLFAAPSLGVMRLAVERLKRIIQAYRSISLEKRFAKAAAAEVVLWANNLHEKHTAHNLLETPAAGRYALMWHYTVYPLKFLFNYTLVDCRVTEYRPLYGRVIASSTVWMAVLSYIMIVCCNYLGSWIGASPLVMGLTIAAVGTSFPNLISSMIVAKQGFGDMAICNCLGSNVFNVNIALGLPYFLLMLIRQGKPYQEIPNGGIVMQVFMLIAVAVVWIAFIVLEGFRMKAWMAWMYIVIYCVVMGIAIGL